jgi:hypothetical protein
MMSLAGCSASVQNHCFPIIRASEETKAWFLAVDTPDHVIDYLDRIGRQQQAIEEVCG